MPESAAVPLIANRYEVIRTLGQGAFGRTFLARDAETGREVAIKMLDTQRVDSFKGFELFEREAAVLRSVRHHGVPEIYDSIRAEWEGRTAAFLVMEYVAGKSLEALIEERHHLDPAEASHILLELLGVLDYLHGRVPPILHRDIKPANIILRLDGFPTLVDFGAVRSAIAPPGRDGSTIVGTYGYMPYEQHMGQATPASDLYALAATFLHLLTGYAPPEFIGAEGRITVPDTLPGGERLQQVLSRMLRLSPAERYQSARDVRQALLMNDSDPVATTPGRALASLPPRALGAPLDFPPAPRAIEGPIKERVDRMKRLHMNDSLHESTGAGGMILVGFLSLVTFGVVPILIWARARSYRQKLSRFFRDGVPAVAEITAMQDGTDNWGIKISRVRYEWQADGHSHRDSNDVQRVISDKWRVGDQVQILYLPDHGYDSLVISMG